MKSSKENIKTPSQFYKQRRPENFSDSEVIWEYQLPREVLSLELINITTNQKENEFELLCRRLAEKLIAPNLIPQVGPTGGGDGKTDSETYSVSPCISDRWFTPENGWEKDEKWAFAISAKETWKSKAESDIKNISGTKRGYTKIYFMTNQLPSSKKKKDAQDELKNEYKLDVVILDGKWILDKVYDNNLIDLVVDCLNLSQTFKNKKTIVGPNDTQRLKELHELEEKINNPKRYSEYDFQLFNDSLDSAIISRTLELPRDEVEGKFDRVKRICKKINLDKLFRKYHYQRAWTYFNYYDDFDSFIEEYNEFKKYYSITPHIAEMENYFTLIQILSTIDLTKYHTTFTKEKNELIVLLKEYIDDTKQTSSALIARTDILLLNIQDDIRNKKDSSEKFKELGTIINESLSFMEYPFELYKDIFEEMGNIFYDNVEFDNLVNTLALVSEKRNSEISSANVYFKRGIQKYENKAYKESIVYFGRSVRKLSKEETHYVLSLVLAGLGYSYRELGLIWAANNCFISSASISLRSWHTTGKINKRSLHRILMMIENELLIGRIPNILSCYEMYTILSRQFDLLDEKEKLSDFVWIDACLGTRLLNSDIDIISQQTFLPDVLDNVGLWMSRKSLLYILGYEERLLKESKDDGFLKDEDFQKYFTLWANQPFKEQMLYKTSFGNENNTSLHTKILGCELIIEMANTYELIIVAEMIFAFIEGFISTSLFGVIPTTENIIFNLFEKTGDKVLSFSKEDNVNKYNLYVDLVRLDDLKSVDLGDVIFKFAIHLFINHFYTEQPFEYITKLFEKEETHERLSLVLNHINFTKNIFGSKPKYTLNDWIDKTKIVEYPLIRIKELNLVSSTTANKDQGTKEFNMANEIRHDKIKIISLINLELWEKAEWRGFGYIYDPSLGLGLFIAFKNGDAGEKIFNEWINRFGKEDKEDAIKITIIRGVSKSNPEWYRVVISSNERIWKLKQDELFISPSKFQEMTPSSPDNLLMLIELYQSKREYTLYPTQMQTDEAGLIPILNYGIKKKELFIRFAWEIDENDMETVAINADDDPFIPADVVNPPIKKTLERIKSIKKRNDKK